MEINLMEYKYKNMKNKIFRGCIFLYILMCQLNVSVIWFLINHYQGGI